MDWTVNDNNPSVRIVDDIVSNLKETLRGSNIKCKVTLSLYWEEITSPLGIVGPIGDRGPIGPCDLTDSSGVPPPDTRRVAEPKEVVVTIGFKMASVHAESLKKQKLKVTTNSRGQSLPTWRVTKLQNELPYCCGVYKRPGFDAAYNAMKALKPHLTETLFAKNEWQYNSGWDEELVSLELFHGWENCISTRQAFESVETGASYVELSLLAVDLDSNFDFITVFLSVLT